MRGVILDAATLGGDVSLESLHQAIPELTVYDRTSASEVEQRIAGQTIVVVNKVQLNESHFARFPDVKLVAVTATGTNNIDMQAAVRHRVAVKNVVHYGTPTIVQHVYSMILALSNHLLEYQRDVSAGQWNQSNMFCLMDHPIRELAGRKLGVIGYGELGKAVAAVAPAFGMEVLIGARPGSAPGSRDGVNYLPLQQLLGMADVVSLHCLLSEQTQSMINADAIALMKNDALLINTARGGLVDEAALAHALKNHQLGGAGFDVLTEEPPVNGNVLLDPAIPNLIMTPHCAWASLQARQRLVTMTADNIRTFCELDLNS